MSLWEFLAAPQMTPFSVALGVVFGLFLLELAALAIGGSLLGRDASADASAELEVDLSTEVDLDAAPEVGATPAARPDIVAELAALDFEGSGETIAPDPSAGAGLLGWLGIGRTPFSVWLIAFLATFGAGGYLAQLLHRELIGGLGPPLTIAAAMLPLAGIAAKHVAEAMARALPSVQSSAVRKDALAGRLGVVTGGVAERGRPAEARVRDGHGQAHYLRVEPFEDAERLEEGAEIVLLRPRRGQTAGVFFALKLDEARTLVASARGGGDLGR